jgi:N-acyl-D-amino-acid deacylase
MYNYLIQKAQIVDGSGRSAFVGDVAISDNKIVEVKEHIKASAREVVDARGLVLAPGFVDIQNHSDSYWQLFDNPTLDSMLAQGFTTIVVGNCGGSLAPVLSRESLLAMQKWHNLSGANINWVTFDEFAAELSKRTFGCNVASLVGYSTIRRGLVGDEVRSLEPTEAETLKRIVWESLEAGAFGLSTGLSYAHEIILTELELFELAKIVAEADGLFSVHLRNESSEVVESVKEAIDLAMHSGVNLKISHLKVRGPENAEHFTDLIAVLETAYVRGMRIGFDIYPYTSVWQPLYTYLPKWAIESGRKQLGRYLADAVQRKKIISAIHNHSSSFGEMVIASTAHTLSIHGKTIGSVARNMGVSSEEAVLEIIDKGGTEVLVFDTALSSEHVETLLRHPMGMVATDGAGFASSPAGGLKGKLVHPRCFGAAPRFIHHMLTKQLLPLEQAIQKLTSMPAEKIGLQKRGRITVGNFADLVLFNPKEIIDHATYKNPYQFSGGIEYVWVNGKPALADSSVVGSHGTFLRKTK